MSISPDAGRTNIIVLVPRTMHEGLRQASEHTGESMSAIIRSLIRDYLAQENRKPQAVPRT